MSDLHLIPSSAEFESRRKNLKRGRHSRRGKQRGENVDGIQAPATAAEPLHTVRFDLEIPQAQRVFVAGTFNSWNPIATPLTPAFDGRVWACELRLPSGRYEYRFVADGEWVDDPNATERRQPIGRRERCHQRLSKRSQDLSAMTRLPGTQCSDKDEETVTTRSAPQPR